MKQVVFIQMLKLNLAHLSGVEGRDDCKQGGLVRFQDVKCVLRGQRGAEMVFEVV